VGKADEMIRQGVVHATHTTPTSGHTDQMPGPPRQLFAGLIDDLWSMSTGALQQKCEAAGVDVRRRTRGPGGRGRMAMISRLLAAKCPPAAAWVSYVCLCDRGVLSRMCYRLCLRVTQGCPQGTKRSTGRMRRALLDYGMSNLLGAVDQEANAALALVSVGTHRVGRLVPTFPTCVLGDVVGEDDRPDAAVVGPEVGRPAVAVPALRPGASPEPVVPPPANNPSLPPPAVASLVHPAGVMSAPAAVRPFGTWGGVYKTTVEIGVVGMWPDNSRRKPTCDDVRFSALERRLPPSVHAFAITMSAKATVSPRLMKADIRADHAWYSSNPEVDTIARRRVDLLIVDYYWLPRIYLDPREQVGLGYGGYWFAKVSRFFERGGCLALLPNDSSGMLDADAQQAGANVDSDCLNFGRLSKNDARQLHPLFTATEDITVPSDVWIEGELLGMVGSGKDKARTNPAAIRQWLNTDWPFYLLYNPRVWGSFHDACVGLMLLLPV